MNRSPSPEPQPEPDTTRQPVAQVPHHMKPIEAAPSVSSQSSPESDGAEPFQQDSHSPYFSQDSSSQQFVGASSREDQQVAKMGFGTFGSFKAGKILSHSLRDKVVSVSMVTHILIGIELARLTMCVEKKTKKNGVSFFGSELS